jgi:hypothetical protein
MVEDLKAPRRRIHDKLKVSIAVTKSNPKSEREGGLPRFLPACTSGP